MKIEVFEDMIVIHSPDNSENNKFKGVLGFKEDEYVFEVIMDIVDGIIYWDGKKKIDVNYNEEK